MKQQVLSLFLFLSHFFVSYASTEGWKNYLAYSNISQVQSVGNKMYVLASGGLYLYNTSDQSIQTFDKASLLSDNGIKLIQWNNVARKLVIVYNNYNIDLLAENGIVENIPDYMWKTMIASKTVNSISVNGIYAYLSTAFGIIKLNVRNAEISETYELGEDVSYTYIANNMLYAGVPSKGMYAVSLSANLQDKQNWNIVATYTPPTEPSYDAEKATLAALKLDAPKYNNFDFITFQHNKLYTVGGGYSPWKDLPVPGIVQVWNGKEWQVYQEDIATLTPNISYEALLCIAVDPADEQHVFASGRTGLYEFRNGRFVQHYTETNSPLKQAPRTNLNYVVVPSITFDSQGNLWVFNSHATNNTSLLMLNRQGVWSNFNHPEFSPEGVALPSVKSFIFDSRNLLWFVNNHWDYKYAGFYNPASNQVKMFTHFVNQDGQDLGEAIIRCVVEDKQQNMWIGTSVGPIMLNASNINNANPSFIQVKVPRNDGTNYADYLLSGLDVTCIAVDGANRKWFGTGGNGVYLISADNLSQIHHFTTENSALLSNEIESIAIDDNSGEVFFGTSQGLCSYMSDATTPNNDAQASNVYAYPNPVKADYMGPISVRGLSFNADVKITTVNGSLVAQGRSNGGTFVWNGTDLNGKRVASGIYFVLSATEEGQKGVVTKIAVVR